jgi:hypothetical protein
MGGCWGLRSVDISEESSGMRCAKSFKGIDFTMLGKKETSVNRRGQDAGKRVGKAHEIIVL